jgi:hypothetical protein
MDDKIQKRLLTAKEYIAFGTTGYEVLSEEVLPEEEEDKKTQ